jgi:hypothetical protein
MNREGLKGASILANVLLICAPGVALLIAMRQTAMDHLLPAWFDSIGTPATVLGTLFLLYAAKSCGEIRQFVVCAVLIVATPSVLPMLIGESVFTMNATQSAEGSLIAAVLVGMPWLIGLICLFLMRDEHPSATVDQLTEARALCANNASRTADFERLLNNKPARADLALFIEQVRSKP